MDKVEARLISDAESLEALVPAWWELWRRAPSATPFQCPAWLVPWWHAFSPGTLFTIACEVSGRLVGLAPLYLEDGHLGRRLLPVGISISDYEDVLVDPAFGREVGECIARALEASQSWDAVEWGELSPEAAALSLPIPDGCEDVQSPSSPSPVLPLPATFAALLESCSARHRRKLRLAQNRADRGGGATLVRAGADRWREILALLFRLHGARWRERNEPGVLADPRLSEFHSRSAGWMAEAGLARFYALQIGGELAAAYYGFQHRGRALGYLVGFDPTHSYVSPGAILLSRAIEQAIEDGTEEFHFLRGNEPYKYAWGATEKFNSRRIFRRIPRA